MSLRPLPTPWNLYNLVASPYFQETLDSVEASPRPLSLFVARERELAQLRNGILGAGELSSRQAVAGFPGVGKTTLVQELKAAVLRDGYLATDALVPILPRDTAENLPLAVTTPTAATRLLVLLGDPVSHSLSPVFQNAALHALGLDAVYLALRCSAGDVGGLLRAIAHAGGGGNVTVPHKEAAARAADRLTPAAERTGAANTFWLKDGEVWGDNTDVDGIRAAIRILLGRTAAGARVVVAGAGGAARAAVHVLLHAGAERVVVVNRTAERARELAARFGAPERLDVVESAAPLASESFDLAVNATSLGLREGDPLPFAPDAGPRFDAALDLVYARGGETPWVRAMRDAGIPAADGTEMLLHQGAAAFRRWWDREPPIGVMRDALLGGGA